MRPTAFDVADKAGDSGIDFNKAQQELSKKKYIAKDGTEFTDEAAYAAYQAALINAEASRANAAAMAAQTSAAAAQAAAAQQAQRTNWIETAKSLLATYDLSSLGDKYISLITTGGYDDQAAMIKLQSEPEWQARFSANQTRLKQGLPVLSPSEYLSVEAAYKDVMIQAGLPESVYKDTTALGKLIAQDVSPTEVQTRINAARAVIDNADPYITQTLQQQFGLSKADMVLHVLDPQVASNVIAQKVQAAEIGGEAARQGVGIGTQTAAELAAQGVTQAQARAGFARIGQELPQEQKLASIYGFDTTKVPSNLIASTFETTGAAQARTEIEDLFRKQIGSFSGSAGVGKGSLGEDQAGNL